jgi:hypothetical protein
MNWPRTNEAPNKLTGAPRFSARRRAGIRTRLVRSTVPVGGCRSVLAFDGDTCFLPARPLGWSSSVKFTRHFEAMRQRPERSAIRLEWPEQVVTHPAREVVPQDGRIRRWAPSAGRGGRCLRGIPVAAARPSATPSLTVRSGYEDSVFSRHGHAAHLVSSCQGGGDS